ncbi:MAG: hypothetical protein ACREEM_50105, partial [Blastocatellia bacterium]
SPHAPIAKSVKLHGARPWHQGKAAVSVAKSVKLHAASAWHLEPENVGNDKDGILAHNYLM